MQEIGPLVRLSSKRQSKTRESVHKRFFFKRRRKRFFSTSGANACRKIDRAFQLTKNELSIFFYVTYSSRKLSAIKYGITYMFVRIWVLNKHEKYFPQSQLLPPLMLLFVVLCVCVCVKNHAVCCDWLAKVTVTGIGLGSNVDWKSLLGFCSIINISENKITVRKCVILLPCSTCVSFFEFGVGW